MKKFIGAVAVGVVLAPAIVNADTAEASGGYAKTCSDGKRWVTNLQVAKQFPSTSCAGARAVMNRWYDRDDCWEGICRVRVGYNGYLWKCDAWREPNQLRRWSVWCHSAKTVWVQKYGGYSASRWMSFTYTD